MKVGQVTGLCRLTKFHPRALPCVLQYNSSSGGVPLKLISCRRGQVKNRDSYTLNYNEFIVYDTKQIKMKYLAKIKFNYKY